MSTQPPSPAPDGTPVTRQRRLIAFIQLASLLATGWMVWSAALFPRVRSNTLGNLLWQVLGYTLLSWAWSAVVALGLYSIIPATERTEMVPVILRTAATAVWFGPAMILLSEFSPASLLAALVLVVYTSRLLYAQWRIPIEAGAPSPAAPRQAGGFADSQLPPQFVWRERMPAVAVALCLQAGVIAVAMHYPLIGAAWLCLGTAMLTVFSMSTGAADAGKPATLPRSIVGILATIVLAALLSVGTGRGTNGPGGPGGGGNNGTAKPTLAEAARAVLRELFYGETPAGGGQKAPEAPKSYADQGPPGGYPGVILWPEVKPIVTLVAPVPPGTFNLSQGKPAQPFSIPFGGEYWLFRWPYARPPANSYFERGTPTKLTFSSTDHRPLQMEAHHKLDTPVALNCCGAIQVEIANADPYGGTLYLELLLLDTENGATRSQTLGIVPIASQPDLKRDPVQAVHETLTYRMPEQPLIDQFNEFKVVFRRARQRTDKSAKVGIERFVLVPR